MLAFEESGTPGAASVLLLHGVGAAGWMWWRLTLALADLRCLNVDLPGHGRSAGVPWRSLADTATAVAAVIADRATAGRAHVVGLSLGGYVALELVRRHPGVVDRVVVSGVTAEPMPGRAFAALQGWVYPALMRQPDYARRLARASLPDGPPEARAAMVEALAGHVTRVLPRHRSRARALPSPRRPRPHPDAGPRCGGFAGLAGDP